MGATVSSVANASGTVVDDDGPVITVVDEGDPNHRILLGATAVAGTTATSTSNYNTEIAVSGQGVPIDLDVEAIVETTRTTEVLTVETDGAYTTRETFTSFNLTTASAEAGDTDDLGLDGSATRDFAPLVDVPLIVEHSAEGVLLSAEAEGGATLTPEQLELVDEVVEGGFGIEPFVAIPPTPVGQGAVWTVADPASAGTLGVPLTLQFTLVSLKGDDYTIEIGIEGDVLEQLEAGSPGTEVTGTLTLTGALTGNAANTLDQQLTMDLVMDIAATEDDVTIDLDARIIIDHTSTPS
jgi:hypothetical protein